MTTIVEQQQRHSAAERAPTGQEIGAESLRSACCRGVVRRRLILLAVLLAATVIAVCFRAFGVAFPLGSAAGVMALAALNALYAAVMPGATDQAP